MELSTNLSSTAPLSLRERSKVKRRQAIKEAARTVFLERGYDEATTREIAERAEVSPGTLFAYAPTKSELLLMILNDDLDEITSREFEGAVGRPLMGVLLDFSESRFSYFHKLGGLAPAARKEIQGAMLSRHELGPEGQRFRERNPRILLGFQTEVSRRQESGTLGKGTDPMLAARLLWAIYHEELGRWLRSPKPRLRDGLMQLRQLFAIALKGLDAADAEYGPEGPPALAKIGRAAR